MPPADWPSSPAPGSGCRRRAGGIPFPVPQCRYRNPDRRDELALRHAELGALFVPPQKLYRPAMSTTAAIRVNCAPALTLWATAMAERLGYPTHTALTLGRFVAGSSARAKAREPRYRRGDAGGCGTAGEEGSIEATASDGAAARPRRAGTAGGRRDTVS